MMAPREERFKLDSSSNTEADMRSYSTNSSETSHSRMSSPAPQSPNMTALMPASPLKPVQGYAHAQSQYQIQHQHRMTTMQVPDPIGSSVSVGSGLNDYMHNSSSPELGPSATPTPLVAKIASRGGIRHCVQMGADVPLAPAPTPTSIPLSTASPLEITSSTVGDLQVSHMSNADTRSFSFQLHEATNNYQNYSLSPEEDSTSASNQGMGGAQSSDGGGEATDRKQKRLQRNRESARLSRRRRKQYLEVLESRVNYLCEEMDKGRREHVLRALTDLQALRNNIVRGLEQSTMVTNGRIQNLDDLSQKVGSLGYGGSLSRASEELMLATTFGREYLKSLVIDPAKKYIMWLTLQNDIFYRGGRAASERLSAARIGEKLRSSGYTHVTPSNGMWPLFCNEVALSYDQEERIRQLQKEIVSNPESWLHRHTGAASEHIIESSHDAITGASEKIEQRSKNLMDVLTPVQKAKYLAWIAKKRKSDHQKINAVTSRFSKVESSQETEPDPQRHDAANLYILNHKLASIANSFPRSNAKVLSSKALKCFSRRPAFESLASVDDVKGAPTSKKMTEEGSSGALKRRSSEMSFDGIDCYMKTSTSGTSLCGMSSLTPEAAQTTCSAHVYQALGNISNLIPSHRLPRLTVPRIQEPEPVSSMTINVTAPQQQLASSAMIYNSQPHQAMIPTTSLSMSESFLPDSLTSTGGEGVSYPTVPIPEPVPVLPQSNMMVQTAIYSVPLEPVPIMPLSDPTSLPLVVPDQTLSGAISAPTLSAFSKVPSPLQTAKEELSDMDDVKFWNVSSQMADDSLFDLTEEDWDIGEGTFWD